MSIPSRAHESEAPKSIALNPDARVDIETTLRIAGMDCADEVEALEHVLRPLKGVREVRVNLVGGKVTLLHDESVDARKLIEAIAPTGLKAAEEGSAGEEDVEGAKRLRQIAVAFSGVFTGLGLLAQWLKFAPLVADIAFGTAIVAGGWFVVPKAWRALRRFALDMNVLMTVAVAGALVIHQWSEGAAVTFLFALSELLEAFSLARARKAVQALMQLTPETALIKEGSAFREVPVAEVPAGSTIAVKSGSRIPLDGEVTSGESAVNQAPITGESMPVEKKTGDGVFAGTINGEGSLEIRTTKPHTETTIAKIIHLVEEAQSQKAPSQRFVDVFARYYTPAVMVGALLVMLAPPLLFDGAWLVWFYRGLVLLVIACPCALVISTPVSVVSGLTAMARRGVLIKGGAVLEAVGKLRALAVDKTGTITEGKPRVTKVIALNSKTEADILRIAAAIDTHSKHPLARAVVAYATEKKVEFPRSENYQAKSGRGAEAVIDGLVSTDGVQRVLSLRRRSRSGSHLNWLDLLHPIARIRQIRSPNECRAVIAQDVIDVRSALAARHGKALHPRRRVSNAGGREFRVRRPDTLPGTADTGFPPLLLVKSHPHRLAQSAAFVPAASPASSCFFKARTSSGVETRSG